MRKRKISKAIRERISKALKSYWESSKGKRRRHIFFKIPEGKKKQFREKESQFKGKKGEYGIRLLIREKPKGGYKPIDVKDFKKGEKYLVYIYHRPTRRSRLLASGRLNELPVATFKQTQEWFRPIISSSRKFNPLPMKKRGAWLPISRFYNRALKHVEEEAAKLKKGGENYKVRGSILPLKRYYHPEMMIFSDEPIKRSKVVTEVFAHVVTAYDYPNIRWISARHVKVEFRKGIRLDELQHKLDRIEDLAAEALRFEHPKAGIEVLKVDGFIPIKFEEKKHEKKASKKKSKKRKK